MEPKKEIIVFEFFSGIGGMHEALKRNDKIKISSIVPFDINPNANVTYKYNFDIKPIARSIEDYDTEDYEKKVEALSKDKKRDILWTMSPPCQPFTRQGHEKGLDDNRCAAFKHLMDIFVETKYKPDYFLLENVRNFEVSKANEMILDILKKNGYHYLQFLLSPLQFNIPNSRLRFYLIAKKEEFDYTPKKEKQQKEDNNNEEEKKKQEDNKNNDKEDDKEGKKEEEKAKEEVKEEKKEEEKEKEEKKEEGKKEEEKKEEEKKEEVKKEEVKKENEEKKEEEKKKILDDIIRTVDLFQNDVLPVTDLQTYLRIDIKKEKSKKEYYLPKKILEKGSSRAMDIVLLKSTSSNCFTKNYSRLIKGSGSMLLLDESLYKDNIEDLRVLQDHIRYFTPTEMLKLFCFGPEFEFPEKVTRTCQYKLLGNSVNVKVVECILKYLLK